MASQNWSDEEKEKFVRMQFNAQHKYYHQTFLGSNFDIIQMNGKDIGRFYVGRWKEETRVIDITILPQFRGRGIGSSLMKAILQEAALKKVAVRIHVEHYNPALSLYQKLGFHIIGDTGVYYFLECRP